MSFQTELDNCYDFGCLFTRGAGFLSQFYGQDFEQIAENFDIFRINKGNNKEMKRVLKNKFDELSPFFTREPFEISFNKYRLDIVGVKEFSVSRAEMISRFFYNEIGLQCFKKFMRENLEKIENYESTFFNFFTDHENKARLDETDNFIQSLRWQTRNEEEFCKEYNMSGEKFKLFQEAFRKFESMKLSSDEKKQFIKNSCTSNMKEIAKKFLEKYGGTISGSAALAFYTGKFTPNDIDVYFTDEEQYKKAESELSCTKEVEKYNSYAGHYVKEISYNLFMGIEFNLVLVDKIENIHNFDMECCRLIWDPTLRDPFSRTRFIDLLAVDRNIITYPIQAAFKENAKITERLQKYIGRGMRIILVDNPYLA